MNRRLEFLRDNSVDAPEYFSQCVDDESECQRVCGQLNNVSVCETKPNNWWCEASDNEMLNDSSENSENSPPLSIIIALVVTLVCLLIVMVAIYVRNVKVPAAGKTIPDEGHLGLDT